MTGRRALITGGASGIGAGIARHLHSLGAEVLIADIEDDTGQRTADEIGVGARFTHLDVNRDDEWAAAIDVMRAAFGGIDLLVNNAAVSQGGSIATTSEQSWRETLDVNATGTFLGCRRGLTAMDGGGAIVNIASARGRRVSAAQLSYSCSKALVIRLTEAVALYCAEAGLTIRCNAICPGVIDTPILEPFYETLGGREAALRHFAKFNAIGRLGTINEVACAVAYLASDDASFITGAILDVDGGFRIRDK